MAREFLDVPFEIKEADVEESGLFRGYGAVFGGKPDAYGDIIVKGAFKESLESGGRNGFGVAMLWQHDSKQPLGIWSSILEDDKGLAVEGRLAVKTQLGREAYELLKMGAIRGLSIGYETVIREYDDANKVRYLKQVNLWEISPVTFPAQTRATITRVKALVEEAKTERELEEALREIGLSTSAAHYIAELCKPKLISGRNQGDGWNMILEELRRMNMKIGG